MAEELDPSMLPNWLRDMDEGPSVRPGADDCARYGLTWCGSFTVHGLGFQAMNGTTTDFAMAWPIGNGGWQVLQDAYDIYDPVVGQDGYIETEDLNDIMRENGFRSLNSFTASEGEGVAREPYACRRGQVVQGALLGPPDLYRWPLGSVQARLLCRRVRPVFGQGARCRCNRAGDGAPGKYLQPGRIR